MGNLLLTFPELAPQNFRPWVNEDDAARGPLARRASRRRRRPTWKAGLAAQGIGAERIKALRDTADFAIYTPGSEAGVPLNVIGSLQAPPLSWETEAETLRDEIEGTVTSLLGLVGIDGRSALEPRARAALEPDRERVASRTGPRPRDADRPGPDAAAAQARRLRPRHLLPAEGPHRAGAEAERRSSPRRPSPPGARASRSIRPRCCGRREGKPRAAIVYLAHLSDDERQFVVTLVLSKLVTWMRGQPGTSDLRTLVYMDEVFGFVPAHRRAAGEEADPDDPQAGTGLRRRHGALDAEPGRPRLQGDVERRHVARRPAADRERQGAGPRRRSSRRPAAPTSARSDQAIGGLEKRQFMLVSAKASQPVVFQTRWAMSYLRGPLTKDQISSADAGLPRPAPGAEPAPSSSAEQAPRLLSRMRRRSRSRRPSRRRSRGLPRSRRAVGAPRRRRARRHAAASVPRRARQPSLRRHEGRRSTSCQEYEALYGPLDSGLDLDTARRPSTTTTGTSSRPRRRAEPHVRLALGAGRRGLVLPRRRARRSSGASSTRRRSSSQRNAKLKLTVASGRDARGVRTPLRRGGAGGGGRRGGEDQASGSRRSRRSSRMALELAQRRVEEVSDRRAHAPGQRADRRRGCGARRIPRRSPEHALDRGRDGLRGLAPRDVGPHRRAQANGRGRRSSRCRTTWKRSSRQILDEVERDRRQVAAKSRRRSRRSRSGPRPPTSGSSDSRCSGCPAAEPGSPAPRRDLRVLRVVRSGPPRVRLRAEPVGPGGGSPVRPEVRRRRSCSGFSSRGRAGSSAARAGR